MNNEIGSPPALLRILPILVFALLAASACSASGTPWSAPALPTTTPDTTTDQSDEPIELVVWAEYFTHKTMSTDPDGAGRYGLYLKEQFEREHPGVTVTIEHHGWDETLRQNLFNALLAGTAPDVVVGENYFRQFAKLNALVPLDDAVADVRDDLIPATYEAATYQGTIYGISAFTGVFGFERNCAVVEQAGLDCATPPQTWTELLGEAKQITERGDGDYYGYTLQGPAGPSVGSAFRIAVFLAQADAPICRDNCTYPYFDNPDAVPVMEFVRELNRYTPPGLLFEEDERKVYSQLHLGLSAYQIAGSWHPAMAAEAGCETCRYSAIPTPENGNSASLVVGNVIYAALQQSDHPQLAAEWVAFLARDDVQALVYPLLGRLPSTRSALKELRPTVDPATQAFIDQFLNAQDLAILPQWQQKPDELWQIYNEMLAEILTTDRPVQKIMAEAQAEADEVMRP